MLSVLVMQWDADSRQHFYYNPDGSTTTDPDAAEVWDDIEAANWPRSNMRQLSLRHFTNATKTVGSKRAREGPSPHGTSIGLNRPDPPDVFLEHHRRRNPRFTRRPQLVPHDPASRGAATGNNVHSTQPRCLAASAIRRKRALQNPMDDAQSIPAAVHLAAPVGRRSSAWQPSYSSYLYPYGAGRCRHQVTDVPFAAREPVPCCREQV